MQTQEIGTETSRPNGPGAATILAGGIGCFALGVLSAWADKSVAFKSHMSFYRPSGPLSGVTTLALLVWLAVWVALAVAWRGKTVRLSRTNLIAFILLGLGLLLTFPLFVDLI
jgi:fluoride ion exporter CrcB/FEX